MWRISRPSARTNSIGILVTLHSTHIHTNVCLYMVFATVKTFVQLVFRFERQSILSFLEFVCRSTVCNQILYLTNAVHLLQNCEKKGVLTLLFIQYLYISEAILLSALINVLPLTVLLINCKLCFNVLDMHIQLRKLLIFYLINHDKS